MNTTHPTGGLGEVEHQVHFGAAMQGRRRLIAAGSEAPVWGVPLRRPNTLHPHAPYGPSGTSDYRGSAIQCGPFTD